MDNKSELLMYITEDGLAKFDVTFDGDTVWLTQDQMAELFQRDKSTISRHIKNVFDEGELDRKSTVAYFQQFKLKEIEQLKEKWNISTLMSLFPLDTVLSLREACSSEFGQLRFLKNTCAKVLQWMMSA